jgi:hypothetical protein
MLKELMSQLAAELEVEEQSLARADGVYALPLDEGLTIKIREDAAGQCLLESSFVPSPQTKKEAFFSQLLLANLFGQGTRRAVLGLSLDGKQLVLSNELPPTVQYKEFRETLEDFMNTMEFWYHEALSYK